MGKNEVSRQLGQIAACLELKGENTFRVRAYRNAARAVAGFSDDLASAAATGELTELKGIGPATLKIIVEILATGKSEMLKSLHREIPAGLVDMMQISGLGVTKIRQIHEGLGLDTLSELEAAARDGRLAGLPRFGPKAAANVLRSLEFLMQVSESRLFHHANSEALGLIGALKELPAISDARIVGSIRRRCELIGDMDFVVQSAGPLEELAGQLNSMADVAEFTSQAGGISTIKFTSGSVAHLYAVSPSEAGFQIVRATGNEDHLRALAQRAEGLGLEWTSGGIVRDGATLPCPTEEDVYATLDLPWIPPELREGRGEVDAAARRQLPSLIEPSAIRGFLHCHTDYSDGTSTVRAWAEAARATGYEYLGITDHSAAARFAGGLYPDAIRQQHAEIDEANAEIEEVTILKGVEVDILRDGSLDYTPEIRATFDFVIASLHNGFGQDRETMTARVLRAMDDRHMTIFGHPTGRLLLARDPYAMDLEAIFAKAAELGVAIEINADPQRLDLDWRLVRSATDAGVIISIGADAHNTAGMTNMDLGVGLARKGWLTEDRVLNARPVDGFLDHVAQRRAN